MSIGDGISLGAVVALIAAFAWLIDPSLRDAYRTARATGVPVVVAIPTIVAAALLNGC